MTDIDTVAAAIKAHHRARRFAIKVQQKIDRALESFLRMNFTDWSPDMDEKEREKRNALVRQMIKAARDGDGDPKIGIFVKATDESRRTWDVMRKENERAMEVLAENLPAFAWVKSVPGFGALGMATIIAETGPLDKYANPQKLWKRLGFAPFEGYAGSTWKRDSWRPRSLSAEEWTDNPFSGARYALMHQIVVWLVNKQSIGAAKTATGVGEPKGPYGKVYFDRRRHTTMTHPDWTKKHSQMDALRITMKSLLLDFWLVWHGKAAKQQPPDEGEERAAA